MPGEGDARIVEEVTTGPHRVVTLEDEGGFRVEVHELRGGEWRLNGGPYEVQTLELARRMRDHLRRGLERPGKKR